MELVYKKVEEKDKEQLFNLIDIVLNGLPDQAHFIPYEQWELDSMFEEVNYASLYGVYDGDKLEFVKETRLSNGFLRKLYMKKLK